MRVIASIFSVLLTHSLFGAGRPDCTWRPLNTTHTSRDTRQIISLATQQLGREACVGTNGTLLDDLDAATCADYRFHDTPYLANSTYALCPNAEHLHVPWLAQIMTSCSTMAASNA